MLMLHSSRHVHLALTSWKLLRHSCSRSAARKHGNMVEQQPAGGDALSQHTSTGPNSSNPSSSKLVMQIILPRSLVTKQKWPVGPLLAQSAHAATAVLHLYSDLPEVKAYLSDWQNMRKTVMEVEDENVLRTICNGLDNMEKKIPYHLWIEQPENMPTALALVPNNRPAALKRILGEAGCKLWE